MEKLQKNKSSYIFIEYIETRFGDPISSMNINSNYCIIGTMLGRLILFNINTHKVTILLDGSDEEILHINFVTNNSKMPNDFYFCIGDSSILKYTIRPNLLDNNNPIVSPSNIIKNYTEDYLHVKYCDNAIVYMTKDIFFMIAIEQIKKKPMILNTTESNFVVKNVESSQTIEKGVYTTTNYIVPFDFDGKYFIFLQFFTNVERMICSFNVYTQKTWMHSLLKSFGVLNYCKLIKDNKLFIVRNLIQCEFRLMDDNFSLTHSFVHRGDQVIACDLFYKIIKKVKKTKQTKPLMTKKDGKINIYKYHKDDTKKSYSDNNHKKKIEDNSETVTKKNNNMNNISDEKIQNIDKSNELCYENENENDEKKGNGSCINENDEEYYNENNNFNNINVKANSLLNIFLLDIDGNVNFYNNENGIKTLFNINKIKEIDNATRERGLFSLNYSYIIKFYHPYLAISTDNGCYIFQLKHI